MQSLASLKKFKSSRHFREQAKVFATESATPKAISAAGEQALVSVYNGTPGESLDSLRYKRFYEKVDSLGLFVCYRAYFSVQETAERVCVAICLRSNHKMTGLTDPHRCAEGPSRTSYNSLPR